MNCDKYKTGTGVFRRYKEQTYGGYFYAYSVCSDIEEVRVNGNVVESTSTNYAYGCRPLKELVQAQMAEAKLCIDKFKADEEKLDKLKRTNLMTN